MLILDYEITDISRNFGIYINAVKFADAFIDFKNSSCFGGVINDVHYFTQHRCA